jgi:hypothetical protein
MRLAIIALALALPSCASSDPCTSDITAFVMAQDFIRRDLRSPSTAEFPLINAEGVSSTPTTTKTGQCAFTVRTFVDAQNGFGATIRQNYTVTVVPDPDGVNWTMEDISRY